MPSGIHLNRIEGSRGEIRIPSLGVVVARMTRPVLLRRREVASPELGRFDLHAAVSYFNQHLWDDQDFRKETVLYLGKRPLKVNFLASSKMLVVPGSLRMEGVEPEWQEA
jgi:hypothetical protein